MDVRALDLLLLEETTWIAAGVTGSPSYDLAFDRFFACHRPWERPASVVAIARFGAIRRTASAVRRGGHRDGQRFLTGALVEPFTSVMLSSQSLSRT